jgi:hypothetical protein
MKPANQLLFATRSCFACVFGLFAMNGSVLLAQGLKEIEKEATRILQSKCFACHNDDTAEGGYSIQNGHALYRPGDSKALPIVNGNAIESEVWRRISSNDAEIRMPSDSAPLLESEQVLLKRWIEETPAWNSFKDQSLLERASPDRLLRLDDTTPKQKTYNSRNPSLLATFSENRKRIYVAGWGELLVWNTETGVLELRWAGFEKRFAAIDLSNDERWLAVSSGQPGVSGNVYLIDLDRPTHAVRVWTASDLPPALRFSSNSKTLAIGSMTGQLVLVDVLTQAIVKEELAHADQILAIEWSSDSSRWITGSRDRTARISEFPSGELKVALGGHERSVCGVGFTSLGPITRDETGTLRLWSDDDAGRVLTKRTDLPPRLRPVFVCENRVHWSTDSQWMTAVPSKMVVEEKDKDEKGNPKTKTNYAFQKQDAVDLPEEFASLHRLNAHAWIGWLTKTGQLHLQKEDRLSEIILEKLYP